jgi:hypothetical protein
VVRCTCFFVTVAALSARLAADCSLTVTGNTPLTDLAGQYRGFPGGLYPAGTSLRPAEHEAVGVDLATNQIGPLNSQGLPDAANGRIVLISLGMSNTQQEFGAHLNLIRNDAARNPRLTLVNGAMSNMTADLWRDPGSIAWQNADSQLSAAGATAAQVQVAWVKVVLAGFGDDRTDPLANFPAFARTLQADLETIARNLRIRYPSIRIAYFSSRIRAYTSPRGLSPEPTAYETGFAVRWAIERQISGAPELGQGVAPWMSWGPYLWADGTEPRSDGLTYPCSDLEADFTHPGPAAERKVAEQLKAFLMVDPTAVPWFFKLPVSEPAVSSVTAVPPAGNPGVRVQFSASAADTDGVREYIWGFGDGTFAYGPRPLKTFNVAGRYPVRLTVVDQAGNAAFWLLTYSVGSDASAPDAPRNLRVVP